MITSEIPPFHLRRGPIRADGRVFHLPLVVRLRLAREGLPVILVAPEAQADLALRIEDKDGRFLSREAIPLGLPATLFLQPGAARVVVEGAPDHSPARLGYYPIQDHFPFQKVLLKVHAFRKGAFPDAPRGKRWKTAGESARDLRNTFTALIQTSDVRREVNIPRYRRFRERFVEDFTQVVSREAAPALIFLSAVGTLPAADLARAAKALARQSDRAFSWLVAVSEARLAREGEAVREALAPAEHILLPVPGESEAEGLKAALAAAYPGYQGDGLVAFLDLKGAPTRDAVAMIRATIAAYPSTRLLYTDEERLDGDGNPVDGVFKPAFNAHLLEAHDYLGALTVLRAGRAKELGLDPTFGGAAPYDLKLRYVAGLDPKEILHLPRVAYSRPDEPPGFPDLEVARHAADALSALRGVPVDLVAGGRHLRPLYPVPEAAPLVSIVVPTRDRAGLMGMALKSLIARTAYRRFEIIIVDNGSVEPETFALFEEVKALWPATKVVRDDGDFNYPRICNNGVAVAEGDLILLLNNDIEVVEPDWLDEMVALAARPGVGIVGAKLLFPDRTLQHGGVIVGLFGYASHWFIRAGATAPGYEDRLLVRQNLSAVTGACLLIRRDVWEAIGPLDAERFAEDCNDIDLCLRARRAGHGVVFTPFALLIHHESASRGRKKSKIHRDRLKAQHARFDAIWHASRMVDPHYSPNLGRKQHYAEIAISTAPEGPRDARTDEV